MDFINQLPDELLENIFELLSPEDIVHIGSVSKRFKVLSQDERLWRTHILQFRDYRDEAEYSMKEAEFIKIMSFAPCFQKIDMEVKDVSHIFPDYCQNKKVVCSKFMMIMLAFITYKI